MGPRHSTPPDTLAESFLAAHYHIHAPDGERAFTLGRCSPAGELDDLPAALGGLGRTWALVTPCNPLSTNLSPEQNQQRLARFRAEVAGLGSRGTAIPTHSSAPDGSWREEGLCVPEIELPDALALARGFQQHAFLFKSGARGDRGDSHSHPALWLVWCGSGSSMPVGAVMLESPGKRPHPA